MLPEQPLTPGETYEFKVQLYGYSKDSIVWSTNKNGIMQVESDSGKLTVKVKAISEGSQKLYVKVKDKNGTYLKKSVTVMVK